MKHRSAPERTASQMRCEDPRQKVAEIRKFVSRRTRMRGSAAPAGPDGADDALLRQVVEPLSPGQEAGPEVELDVLGIGPVRHRLDKAKDASLLAAR